MTLSEITVMLQRIPLYGVDADNVNERIRRMWQRADAVTDKINPFDPWADKARKIVMDAAFDAEAALVYDALQDGRRITEHLHSYEARRMVEGAWEPGRPAYATKEEIRGY